MQPVENIDIDLQPEENLYCSNTFLLSSILVNNRVIVIENRQKIFQLQLQLSTFENFQLQLQLQQNRVINYNFVNYNNNFSKPWCIGMCCFERKKKTV